MIDRLLPKPLGRQIQAPLMERNPATVIMAGQDCPAERRGAGLLLSPAGSWDSLNLRVRQPGKDRFDELLKKRCKRASRARCLLR